jgi:two-component system response regulator AtoC
MADFEDTATHVPALEDSPAQLCVLITVSGVVTTRLLPETGEVTIGREPSCDIVIAHSSVSRRHAMLRSSPLEIIDLGSRNGTRVRGVALEPRVAVPLAVGDSIQIGSMVIFIHASTQSDAELGVEATRDSSAHRLELECSRSARTGSPFAFVRFETRSPGGDTLDALRNLVRTSDLVGSEDPFSVWALLVDTAPEPARHAVARMMQLLEQRDIRVTTGIACYPQHGVRAEQLSAHAWEQLSRPPDAPSTEMDGVREMIGQVAASDVSVLISGETGVGKELYAEMLHRLSPRATKPFVRLNCAAVVESLFESELFGHERGAFTGALSARAGLLEAGNGGTVFLDEIGELPLNMQSKLLRVLEERTVQRVGSVTAKLLDVRFIFASNRSLADEAEAGRFRRDLYYRINGVTITIPPLRERRAEIMGLVRAFTRRARPSGPLLELPPNVLARLERHAWPGNIRELRNVVERAVLLSSGGALRASQLALDAATDIATRPIPRVTQELEPVAGEAPPLPTAIADLERERIVQALEQCGGNQSRAARMLGISRNTLLSRLDQYGIARPRKA